VLKELALRYHSDLKQKAKHTIHTKQNLDIEKQSIKTENIKTENLKTENIN